MALPFLVNPPMGLPPAPSLPAAMPSVGPQLVAPALPAVTRVPTAADNDLAERNRLVSTGSGVSQVHNPWLHGLAKAADIGASVFGTFGPLAHAVATTLPGTTLHHNILVHQADQRVAQDQEAAQAAANLEGTQASTRLTTDKAKAAEAPQEPDYEYTTDQHGNRIAIRKGSTQAETVTDAAGNPVGVEAKTPTTPLELALRDNPNLTAKEWQATQDHPLTQPEADALNATWNPVAGKHGLPTDQFKAGTPRAEATMTAGALNNAIGKQQGDTRVQVTIAGQAAQNARNAPLDPSDPDMAAAVQSVANGSAKLGDLFGRATTTAQKAKILAAVKSINPNFNSGDHDLENKARAYYTGGGGGGQTLTAFNTAQAHLDILRQASDALHNGDIQLFNKLGNQFATATGGDAPTNFDAVKNAVKGEVARALTGHVTVSEQSALDKDFNSSMSPRQLAGVAHKYIQLIDGKKVAMRQNYEASQQGKPDFGGNADGGGKPDYIYVPGKGLVKQ